MELLQLRYFYESAISESFAETAKRHIVPTTSVSAAVGRLEKELGKKLFDRKANKIVLNENGRNLQRSLCIVFEKLDKITGDIRAKENQKKIRLLVRAERKKVTERLIKFSHINPMVQFEVIYDFDKEYLGDYDIIIDCENPIYKEYDKYEFYNKRLGFKVSANHHLCGKRLTVSDLAEEKFITMGEKTNTHKLLVSVCAAAGFTPNIVMQCNDALCFGLCIESGLGIGIGNIESISPKQAMLDVTNFSWRHVTYIYYKEHEADESIGEFIEYMKKGDS